MNADELRVAIERIVADEDFGRPTARKRGRDPRWPYVPVIDHGTYTTQIRALAYTTRAEAIAVGERYIEALRAGLAERLADRRHRALRESYGLPRDVS